MDLDLRDRVYLLTGATRGLGRATAEVLIREGANLVISSRHEDAVAKAAAELGGHDRVVGLAADNAEPGAAERLVAAGVARFGRLDGALVSVGGPPAGGVGQVTEGDWRHSFETIFIGGLRIARAAATALGDGGSIVFILSSSVRSPIGGLVISNGLRPGLAMVAKTLADELGPRGVRVNGLMPGRIDTDRVRELDDARADPAATRARFIEAIPLGRYGTPEEFGTIAAFVLSPVASYMTGAMIPIDGGALRTI